MESAPSEFSEYSGKLEIERLLDAFEREWRLGRSPDWREYIPNDPMLRADAAAELQRIDGEYRILSTSAGDRSLLSTANHFDKVVSLCEDFSRERSKDRKDLRSYLVQVGEDHQPTLLRNLLEYEVRNRRKVGEAPTAQEYIELLPEYEALIRRIFLDTSSVSIAAGWAAKVEKETCGFVLPASRLGEYRLVREIGRGGMGAVFEAIHLTRGHRVALKTLPAVSGDSLHRFKREFRALADVTHPNLVGLRTLENDGGQWFITLDLLEGCDFLNYVRPTNQLDVARLRAALGQLAAGLMALHARGIVHRDLKPGNVMVNTQGRVIILDFGLVAELDRAGMLSATGMFAGTPAYMAPEQAAGEQVGPPADWYAFGVMLYEALTGKRPFSGEARRIVLDKQQLAAPPISDSSLPAGLRMRRLIAVHSPQQAPLVRLFGQVREQFRHPQTALAVLLKLPVRRTPGSPVVRWLSVILLKLRLVVERVNVGWSAAHAQEDDALR